MRFWGKGGLHICNKSLQYSKNNLLYSEFLWQRIISCRRIGLTICFQYKNDFFYENYKIFSKKIKCTCNPMRSIVYAWCRASRETVTRKKFTFYPMECKFHAMEFMFHPPERTFRPAERKSVKVFLCNTFPDEICYTLMSGWIKKSRIVAIFRRKA